MRTSRTTMIALVALTTLLIGCGGGERAQAKGPKGFWGLVAGAPMVASDFSKIKTAGVSTFRVQLQWAAIQPTKNGRYGWASIDAQFAELARNGIEPLPYLIGSPAWVGGEAAPPIDNSEQLGAWSAFTREAVGRYGPNGKFWERFAITDPGVRPKPARLWEVWIEPNIPAFWKPRPSTGEYAKLFNATAKAVRAVDPDGQSMVAGVFTAPGAEGSILGPKFLDRLLSKKATRRRVDVVGMHPYAKDAKGVGEQTLRIRKAINGAGGRNLPIMVDEIGWGSDPTADSLLAKSPAGQAKALKQSFNLLLKKRRAWKIRNVVWYQYRDPDEDQRSSPCPFCDRAGLLNANRTPKPAWNAFLSFTGGH